MTDEVTIRKNYGGSLSYDTNSLYCSGNNVIIQESNTLKSSSSFKSCWNILGRSKSRIPPSSVSLRNILWVKLDEFNNVHLDVLIPHKSQNSRNLILVQMIETISESQISSAHTWVNHLLQFIYHTHIFRPRLLIIINPIGGQGDGMKCFETQAKPIFQAARCHLDIRLTEYQGHAKDIASSIDYTSYDCIVCVSGDGIIHEVINGLALQGKKALKLPIGTIPAGSGNALSACLLGPETSGNPIHAALGMVKGIPMRIDLCSFTQEGNDERTWSFLTQAFGQPADVDLKTEWMRKLGDARFVLGFLWAIFRMWSYEAEIAIRVGDKDKESIRRTYHEKYEDVNEGDGESSGSSSSSGNEIPKDIYGSVKDPLPNSTRPNKDTQIITTSNGNSIYETNDGWFIFRGKVGNFYSGKIPYVAKDFINFPCALPHDGYMDLVLISIEREISRKMAIKILLEAARGKHFNLDYVRVFKAQAYRVTPISGKIKTQNSKTSISGSDMNNSLNGDISEPPLLLPNGRESHIAIDGEKAPYRAFQVEVHKGLARVMSPFGRYTKVDI